MLRVLFSAIVIAAASQAAAPQPRDARALLHPLVHGSQPVGFRALTITDPSRAGRQVGIHLWYPAAACEQPLAMVDYFAAEPPAVRDAPGRMGRMWQARQRLAGALGPIQHDTWEPFAALRMIGCADAAVGPGSHPVIAGRFNSGAWPLQAEYLASHGYAVAVVASRGAGLDGPREDWPRQVAASLLDQVRDMETAVAHLPSLGGFDVTRLGVYGAGDAAMPFVMQSTEADAVALDESGVFSPGLGGDAVRLLPTWRPARLRAAVMHLQREDSAGRETRLDDLRAMRYVPRLRIVLGGSSSSHEDLTTSAYALRRLNGSTDAIDVAHMRAFESGLAAARTFFDAYVRGDAAARARVEGRDIIAAGAGTIEWFPATPRAPGTSDLLARASTGAVAAVAEYRTSRALDPSPPALNESALNTFAYGRLAAGRHADAIAIFQLVADVFPDSPNAWDSLAEAHERTGDQAASRKATERGLARLSRAQMPPAQLASIEAAMRGRLLRFDNPAATPAAAPLPGLPYGSSPVGFRIVSTRDAARKRDLRIHVWYPAVRQTTPMRLEQHLSARDAAHAVAELRTLMSQRFGPVPDGSLEAVLAAPLRASRDTPHAPGRFPLVVSALRELSMSHTNEVLASHGFVVAAVEFLATVPAGTTPLEREGAQLAELGRDLEAATTRLRREPYVREGLIGTMGFSASGLPGLVLAGRSREVGAVALLESGWHGPLGSSLAHVPELDLGRMRAPLFYAWSDALTSAIPHMRDVHAMTNARTIARATAGGISHWDFASEGYLAAADGHWRAADRARVRRVFEDTNRLLVAFFDRHLRGNRDALPSAGSLSVRELPATATQAQSSPNAQALAGIWRGTARAARTLSTAQTADVAFDIVKLQDGVGLYMTLPRLHAWRMPVGYLKAGTDGSWTIADWHLVLRRQGDKLTGELGDPRVTFEMTKTGALPVETPLPTYPSGPEPAWTYDTEAPVWAPVALHGAMAYAADTRGRMHAVNTADGTRAWMTDLGAPMYGQPLVTTTSIVVMDDAGVVRKLDRETGREAWKVGLGADPAPRALPAANVFTFDFHAPAPAVHLNTIFLPSSAGVIYGLDARTGAVAWKAETGAKIRAGVAVTSTHVYAGTLDNHVIAIERRTGKQAWRFKATGPVTSTPVLAGGNLLVTSRGGWITALDAATGQERWSRYDWFSWIESTGVVRGETFYVGSSDLRAVRALDVRTGKTIWETDVLGWAWGTPLVDRDVVYIGVAGPRKYVTKHASGLVALDRRTGAVLWRRAVPPDASAFVSGYPGSVAMNGTMLIAPNVAGRLEGYRIPR